MVLSGVFNRHHIAFRFNDTDYRLLTRMIRANGTLLTIGQVMADLAMLNAMPDAI